MPFVPVETVQGASNAVLTSISYRRPWRKNKSAEILPRLVIGIPKALAGGFTVAVTDRFAINLGTGCDAGKVHIVRSSTGGGTAKEFKGAVTFRFGFIPMLGSDAAEKEFVISKPIRDGFEITLPPWFKSDELVSDVKAPPEKKAKK